MSLIRIQSLQERFISFSKLNEDWKGDKRYPEQAIQRFITLNRESFSFLGISAKLDEVNYEKGIRLIASHFVGAVSLKMPTSGIFYTDIQVMPRFGENISELAYLLKDTIEPDYFDQVLHHPNQLKAPLYSECINYFHSFLEAIPVPWNKFNSSTKIETHPCSSTDWSKHIQKSVNPDNMLKFDNRKHLLSRKHKEWQKLTFVLNFALHEFESSNPPLSVKLHYLPIVSALKKYSSCNPQIYPSTKFQTHSFDPIKIKDLKKKANQLLEHKTANQKSWRIDSSKLFEKYVQYIFGCVANTCGAHVRSNHKFSIKGGYSLAWTLQYLEPDIILQKDRTLYFIDAKYKAHMLNPHLSTDIFKETFRTDLHQVLAYSSFDTSKNKKAILVYPCNKFINIKLEAVNNIGNARNQILLIGLPFTAFGLKDLIKEISKALKYNLGVI